MPIASEHFRAGVWTKELFERSVKYAMDLDKQNKPLKEMRMATIILEGDLRVRIRAWDKDVCVVRYGKRGSTATLPRRFMNFRYLKEKARVI